MTAAAVARRIRMNMNEPMRPYQRFCSESYDIDAALSHQESELYGLVHALLHETCRLQGLVIEARSQANALAPSRAERPYPMVGEDAYDGCLDDHPAMLRYFELYGEAPF